MRGANPFAHLPSYRQRPHNHKVDPKRSSRRAHSDKPAHSWPYVAIERRIAFGYYYRTTFDGQTRHMKHEGTSRSEDATAPESNVFWSSDRAPEGKYPEQIRGFRIIRKLGEGGMGTVWEAEQDHPRRDVALKMVRPGLASPELLKRFEHETHVLGLLQHPGIAQIYEAGTTDTPSGPQPYFAMELIHGEPLTTYLRDGSLNIRERMSLLKGVCEAVHYAHQKGVVHRDLKPANILVDQAGRPKILDFGLAKLTHSDIAITTIETEVGRIQGTLPYMSPEQVRSRPDEIDARTDVYSLGVLLYEVASGQLPFEIHRGMLPEAVRMICEDEPRKLSTLDRTLRGDLETIAIKAMAKNPDERYQSADALASEIERYLTDQPITARPPTAAYHLRKLMRRHKVYCTAAALVFFTAIASAISLSVLYTRANESRVRAVAAETAARADAETANQVSEFMVGLFHSVDASQARGEATTAREILDRGADRIREELRDQPFVQARLMSIMGSAYESLGMYEAAKPLLETSLLLRRERYSNDHMLIADGLNRASKLLYRRGEFAASESLLREAVTRCTLAGREKSGQMMEYANNLAATVHAQGRLEEAEHLYREVLTIGRNLSDKDSTGAAMTMNNMALVMASRSDFDGAEQLLKDALSIQRKLVGDVHPAVATTLYNLGNTARKANRLDNADDYLSEALAVDRKLYTKDHPHIAKVLLQRANIDILRGHYANAAASLRDVMHMQQRLLGPNHRNIAVTQNSLATALLQLDRYDEANEHAQIALATERRFGKDDSPRVKSFMGLVAMTQWYVGNISEAEQTFRDILGSGESANDVANAKNAETMGTFATFLTDTERHEEAEVWARKALEHRRAASGPRSRSVGGALCTLADPLAALGKTVEAEKAYEDSLSILRETIGDEHVETALPLIGLGKMLTLAGRAGDAEPFLRKALVVRLASLSPESSAVALARLALGSCLSALRRFDEAEPLLLKSHATLRARLGPSDKDTLRAAKRLVTLYESGHNPAQAEAWRTDAKSTSPARPDAAQHTERNRTKHD